MSSFESEAKPLLQKLIRAESAKLSKRDQESIAKWIAMKVIVAEHENPALHVTLKEDRELLMNCGHVPQYFDIRIGAHSLDTKVAYVRRAKTMLIGPAPNIADLAKSPTIKNFQDVHFIIGKLLVVAGASRSNIRVDEMFGIHIALPRISPASQDELVWPPHRLLNLEDVRSLSERSDAFESSNKAIWLQHPLDPVDLSRFGLEEQ